MTCLLLVAEEAQLDIVYAYNWYENIRTGLGEDFELCVFATLNQVQRSPLLFQIRYENIRVAFTERFPYGIHFSLENETIIVIGVYHTSREPNNWIERLIN